MRSRPALLLLPALALACTSAGSAPATTPQPAAEAPRAAPGAGGGGGGGGGGGVATSIAARTGGTTRQDGLLPLHLDASGGRLLLEIPRDSMRVLTFTTLATGLGSNPIGLDRGVSGDGWVTRFQRSGDRVLVIFENWNYRSSDERNGDLARTVAEAFPPSTVAALPLLAVEGNRLLVDATDFVMRDWMGVARTLAGSQQGTYSPVRDRSYVNRAYTKAFPENTEVDVAITYATQGNPGRIVSQIAPDGSAITLRHHLSFVALPDASFRPRPADPRVGYFGIQFHDFAQPIGAMLEQRWRRGTGWSA